MYTTRLLDYVNDRMPRRHQAIAAVLIVFISLASIAGSVSGQPAAEQVQPIVIVATPTAQPTGAVGLAKEAGRMDTIVSSPALALSTPTAAPPAAVVVQPEQVQTSVHEKPSTKKAPR